MKLLLCCLLLLTIVLTAGPNGCTGQLNMHPLIDAQPILVREVLNGQKYTIGNFTFI